jgi:DNA-binding transcriptional LysR family regulator
MELGNKNFTKDIFKELPLIYREKGSGTRQAKEQFIEKNNIKAIKKMELTTNEVVKQALLAGLGYYIMPLIGIKNELHNNELQIISVKGLPIITTWSLIWLKEKKQYPLSEALQTYIKKEGLNIVQNHFSWYEQY